VKWLLDTNVVSEGMRPRPDRRVLNWLDEQLSDDIAVSDITFAELSYGAANTPDRARREKVEDWLSSISDLFRDRTLPISVVVLTDWLILALLLRARGRPQSAPDLLIASTARVHGLVVVSRNVRGFADTGVVVYDPWHDKTHRMGVP
jgi:toxin FitB